jgi:hypothetical protein
MPPTENTWPGHRFRGGTVAATTSTVGHLGYLTLLCARSHAGQLRGRPHQLTDNLRRLVTGDSGSSESSSREVGFSRRARMGHPRQASELPVMGGPGRLQ